MQALQVVAFGETPEFCEVEVPLLASDQVLLRIKACGLNFADLLMIKGSYQDTPEPPFTIGLELAGEIIDIGDDVKNVHVGQQVFVYSGKDGLAEFGVFDAERCIAIPEGLDVITAAGFQIAYGTSHIALDHRAQLKQGETLVVLGAAGGVEAIVCILSILNGKIHQTINIENLDQECDLNVNHESSIDCDINFALSNSFGFGGTNGSLIFSKFKD